MFRSSVAPSRVSPDEHHAQSSSTRRLSQIPERDSQWTAYPEVQFISIRLLFLILLFVVLEIGLSEIPDRLPPRGRSVPNIRVFQISPVVNIFARFVVVLVDPRFPTFGHRYGCRRCHVVVVFSVHLPTLAFFPRQFSGPGGLLDSLRWFGIAVQQSSCLDVIGWGMPELIFVLFCLDRYVDYRVNPADDPLRGPLRGRAFCILRWLLLRWDLILRLARCICGGLCLSLGSTGWRFSGRFSGCRSFVILAINRDDDRFDLATLQRRLID